MSLVEQTDARIGIWHRLEGTDAGDIACFSQVDELENPKWTFSYEYHVPLEDLREDEPHYRCFRVNNRLDGVTWEHPVAFDTRSLSVGDIVEVRTPFGDEIFWAVNRSGYATVSNEKFYAGVQGIG
tara:strand:- start:77 stop:454 length:378 start_codon:yes stop_codon:yes gene_type:complete